MIFLYRLIGTDLVRHLKQSDQGYSELKEIGKPGRYDDFSFILKAIRYLNESEKFQGIFDPFLETIEHQISFSTALLGKAFSLYDLSESRFTDEAFGEAFYQFLRKYLVEKENKGYEFSTSKSAMVSTL